MEAGSELAVFGDGGTLTLEVSREVRGERVRASDVGRRLQAEWVIGKALDRYSGTVVGVVTSDGVAGGGSGDGRKVVVYVSLGGRVGRWWSWKVMYMGGWTNCIMLKEVIGLKEVRRKVSEITGNDLTAQKLWYSLKYDRGMGIELEGDGDVRIFLKENDEHGYLYVGDSDGTKRRTQKVMWSYDHGIVYGRSGRDRDDMVQEGRKRAGRLLRVSGEIIKLSDNDEISIASEDVGDNEVVAEGGEEGSKGKGLGKKMDKHKQDILKWKNGWGRELSRSWLTLTNGWVVLQLWSAISVELTNMRKLVTVTRQIIYNQLVHPMETHDMGIVEGKSGMVVSGDDLDDDYNRCILPPNNGRHPGRTPSKRRDYEGDVVEVEDLLDDSYLSTSDKEVHPCNLEMVETSFETVVYAWFCAPNGLSAVTSSPTPICIFACSVPACLPNRRQMFAAENHALKPDDTATPCLYFNVQVNYCMFNGGRRPSMLTDAKTNVYHGKPCFTTSKPMDN
ncbi:hypothetical protein Cgig2_004681 [Carnegiea gigantea]|uniref:Uncharacterized protein n=1 Tax=Carnegiea gigantea TaxID=171969 RepID=A0A9Q1JT46_9CARY|nr:hypothetical protein Cgig2_004681 [Carnegiea gigantea]